MFVKGLEEQVALNKASYVLSIHSNSSRSLSKYCITFLLLHD